MPQDQDTVDPVYKQGFETGYWLQRGNSPQLEQAMKDSAGNAQLHNGMKGGSEQARREAFRERNSAAKSKQTKEKGKDIGME